MSRTRRITLIVVIIVLTVAALGLSRWQWNRLQSRRSHNNALLAARALDPLTLTSTSASPVPGRRLRVRGTFIPVEQIALRGRVHDAAPGLEIATAFRVAGSDKTLWVLRGFVASPDAASIPVVPLPASGEVTLQGLSLPVPTTTDAGQPLVRGNDTTWRRLDQGVLRQRTPLTYDVYLLLSGDEGGPGRLPSVAAPTLDNGPHLSYALQWFGIALAIAAFGIIALRRTDHGSAPPLAAP